ncbi:MAG: hypothetical protein JW969_14835 [Spirochaetales bacterium]|nr:hypothetical protein [Spirochaetales bacterium]
MIKNGLKISVNLTSADNEKRFIYGNLRVINNSDKIQLYGNDHLFLIGSEVEMRAYIDSIASMVIDFSEIEINPDTVVDYKIYFPYPESIMDYRKLFSGKLYLIYR